MARSFCFRTKVKTNLGFDPLLKGLDGQKSTNKLIVQNTMMLNNAGAEYGYKFVGPFVMAMVMGNCVRRSNALNKYSPKLVYRYFPQNTVMFCVTCCALFNYSLNYCLAFRESEVYASFFAGFVNFVNLMVFGTVLVCPPLQWLMRKFVLPAPGQGPSEKDMDDGFLKVTAVGHGAKNKVSCVFYFPTDAGYRDTVIVILSLILTIR